jgi:hypothetical protein
MSDQTKSFFAANWFKLFFVALAVILLIIYYSRESGLDACIEQARADYSEDWNFQCSKPRRNRIVHYPASSLTKLKRQGKKWLVSALVAIALSENQINKGSLCLECLITELTSYS